MIKEYSLAKDANKKVAKNFKVSEFRCNDGSDQIFIADDLVSILQRIRDYFGGIVTMSNSYRTFAYNTKTKSTDRSQHCYGCAADITVKDANGKIVPPRLVAQTAEAFGVPGVGLYNTFTHVDCRAGVSRWTNFGVEKSVTSHIVKPSFVSIRKGETDPVKVAWVQLVLNRKGFNMPVNGCFDNVMELTVKRFQGKNNLAADGIVGPRTQARL